MMAYRLLNSILFYAILYLLESCCRLHNRSFKTVGSLLNCQSCSVLQALNTLLFYIKAGRQVCWILLPFLCGRMKEGWREAVKEQERKGGVNRPIRRPAWGSGTWLHTAASSIIMRRNAGAWPWTFDAFMCLWVRLYSKLLLILLTLEFTELPWPASCRNIALSMAATFDYLFFPWCSCISNTIQTASVTATSVAHWCWCSKFWPGKQEGKTFHV